MKFGRMVWFVLGAPFLTAGALISGQNPATVLKESRKWVDEGDTVGKPPTDEQKKQ